VVPKKVRMLRWRRERRGRGDYEKKEGEGMRGEEREEKQEIWEERGRMKGGE
jgi:hypothetical protein